MRRRDTTGAGRFGSALLLSAAVPLLIAAQCGEPRCQVLYPATVHVRLADGWPGADGLVLAVACPHGGECGFEHRLEIGFPGARLAATTVFRPQSVVVTVTDQASGRELLERLYDLDYESI